MLHINNNTAVIKREILVRIAKLMLEGKLEEVRIPLLAKVV